MQTHDLSDESIRQWIDAWESTASPLATIELQISEGDAARTEELSLGISSFLELGEGADPGAGEARKPHNDFTVFMGTKDASWCPFIMGHMGSKSQMMVGSNEGAAELREGMVLQAGKSSLEVISVQADVQTCDSPEMHFGR